MIRRIIHIDKEKCNGCGLCVDACHEGAIGLEDNKAVLLRDDYCDGLGDCLPACPTGAISFEEREALPYDEAAVLANQAAQKQSAPCACPGSQARRLAPLAGSVSEKLGSQEAEAVPSFLGQWPVQIKLVPVNAAFFTGADILIAADCTAFAYGDFHHEFMRGKITLIGCPKLDEGDYVEKLSRIFKENDVKSVSVARMTVPCCKGIEHAVRAALDASGKPLPLTVIAISPDGGLADSGQGPMPGDIFSGKGLPGGMDTLSK